ncbi:MAG: glycosyltransferase, partial [Methylocella sp.]
LNPVIPLMCDGISHAGAEIVDVPDPCRLSGADFDIFQLHWPELFWWGRGRKGVAIKSWQIIAALRNLKQQGVRIVWMVHNLEPHEMGRWQRIIWSYYQRELCRLASGFLTLCPSTISLVHAAFPRFARIPRGFAWHPAYTNVTVPDSVREETRAALHFDGSTQVFACLGLIRAYKGIDKLVRAFRQLPDADVGLIVAGAAADNEIRQRVSGEAEGDPRIRLDFRFLEEAELRAYTAASDVIVLPYLRYLHSGSLVHALSGQRMVLTPDTPFAHDLYERLGPEWVHLYNPPLTPQIMASLRQARPSIPCPIQERLSYIQTGAAMVQFYNSLIG